MTEPDATLQESKTSVTAEQQQEWSSSVDHKNETPPFIKKEEPEVPCTSVQSEFDQDPSLSQFNILTVKGKEEEECLFASSIGEIEVEALRGTQGGSWPDKPLAPAKKMRKHPRCHDCRKRLNKGVHTTAKKATTPKQRTVGEVVRNTLFQGCTGEFPGLPILQISEIYKDFHCNSAPLITQMSICADVPLVDCTFGKVPFGSPLSYQHPVATFHSRVDAPPQPPLPLANYKLAPPVSFLDMDLKQQQHLKVLETNWELAHSIESSTRESSTDIEQLQKHRVTSRFREIANIRGKSGGEHLAHKMLNAVNTPAMKRDTAMRPEALKEYCRSQCFYYTPCGFVIHPAAPWLGVSPDGLVYDPSEIPQYGLVHVKCLSVKSFVDCRLLKIQHGSLELKKTSDCYWQMQGEMMVTGIDWCDLLVFTETDMLVQRIYRDSSLTKLIKDKTDRFYFSYYMPRFL